MSEIGRYDSSMQMFVEGVREPKVEHLLFQRGLAEKDPNYEHPVAGPPSGPAAEDLAKIEAVLKELTQIGAAQKPAIQEQVQPGQ